MTVAKIDTPETLTALIARQRELLEAATEPRWSALRSEVFGSIDYDQCIVAAEVRPEDAALIAPAVNSHAAALDLAEAAERYDIMARSPKVGTAMALSKTRTADTLRSALAAFKEALQ